MIRQTGWRSRPLAFGFFHSRGLNGHYREMPKTSQFFLAHIVIADILTVKISPSHILAQNLILFFGDSSGSHKIISSRFSAFAGLKTVAITGIELLDGADNGRYSPALIENFILAQIYQTEFKAETMFR